MSLGFALLGPLAGCDLGPDYARPGAEMPAAWRASATTAAQAWPSPDWWRGFRSPELDALIDLARMQNLDIAAAIARVRQADAQVRIAGAAAAADPGRDGDRQLSALGKRQPPDHRNHLADPVQHRRQLQPLYRFPAIQHRRQRRYEADFWGKNAAEAESARASAVFSRFDQEVVALTVVTNVATTWFTALDLQDRLAIARQNLSDAEKTLAVIQARLSAGTATALDVSQQEALVAGQRAVIPNLQNQLEQQLIGLGILVGRPPRGDHRPAGDAGGSRAPGRSIPGCRRELLARRPDVAEAEAQLVAANANIKAARAAFFPTIQLTGSAGYQSLALTSLFGPGATVISLAANLTQPIFDAGTLRGQLEQSRGRYDELVADYRKSILQAFTDVENALTALRYTAEQLAPRGAGGRHRAARRRHRPRQVAAGTVDITTVLTAQQRRCITIRTLLGAGAARAFPGVARSLQGARRRLEPARRPIPGSFPGLSPGRIEGGVALPVGDNLR